MIEAIRKPISTGLIDGKMIRKNKEIEINEVEVNAINIEHLKEQIDQYIYQTECYKDKDRPKDKKQLNIEVNQIKELITRGYDLETLTLDEIDNLKEINPRVKQKNQVDTQKYERAKFVGDKVDRLQQHPEGMYMYGMNHTGKLSINELYKGSYTIQGVGESKAYSFEQISNILNLNGVENTKGNQWAADTLLTFGLDVSKESIVKVQNIKAAVDGLKKEEEIQKAEEDIEVGNMPGDRLLLEEKKILYVEKDIQEIIDELTRIEEKDIKDTLLEGKEITIGNLREVMHLNTKKALGKSGVSEEIIHTERVKLEHGLEEQTKQTKEQLREIRAKLNTEAAIKISEKMPLESTELSKIVKALNAIEDQKIEVAIQKMELPPTQDVKQLIKDTLQVTNQIQIHTEIAIGVELEQGEQGSLEAIGKAINTYEENFLKAEKRFGETVVSVENQIEDFLGINGIEGTRENISAAKALISNELDLTATHLEEAARILNKINLFIEEMTPERAAILIKEGVNPYKSSINKLLDWVSLERLPQLKNSIAEVIVGLETQGQINETQKQGLLGLYRIIGGLTQNKEQVAGYIYKNKLPLTIDKLEEAVKYMKNTQNIDISIDDQFGELEELKYTKQTAKQMIEEAYQVNDELVKVLEEVEHVKILLPDKMPIQLADIGSRIYPFIKSQVRKELGKFEGTMTLSPSMIEKLNGVKEVSSQVLEMMNKQEIPLTLSNIYWVEKLVENPNLYAELAKQGDLQKDVFEKDLEVLEKELENLRQEAIQSKEASIDKGDIVSYRNYKKIEEFTTVQKQLIDKEGLYQIPFVIEGQTKLVNLYINKRDFKKSQNQEEIKAVITYHTRELGTIVAKLEIKNEQINYSVQGETQEITKKLRQSGAQLQEMLKGIGYLVIGDEYIIEKSDNVILNPAQNKQGDSYFEEVV